MYMTLPECMTLPELWPTTIFSVKLMHLCIGLSSIQMFGAYLMLKFCLGLDGPIFGKLFKKIV